MGAGGCFAMPMVAVEFRLLLFLALMPVAEPWDAWESAKPTLPVRNVWAAAKPACASFFPLSV